MTGPEHYRAAERLQEHPRTMADADDSPDPAVTAQRIQRRMADLADAQVHAMLALGRGDRGQCQPERARLDGLARGGGQPELTDVPALGVVAQARL
jgi:hypothetical protein